MRECSLGWKLSIGAQRTCWYVSTNAQVYAQDVPGMMALLVESGRLR